MLDRRGIVKELVFVKAAPQKVETIALRLQARIWLY